ncbi:FAD-dependent oxidoreductase [Cronbergia sp. UHCC 0137]|uniref:FAD-dependent oxidoreductase n=1 Tax=Cronbergia sp. UHCC 0137 TaxID=3110239 RepID=UPI002B220CB3|nr:FAD-dependent oxidoreductase [Cronbergia sp. UHCC 0137]MEA5616899.1 FAD-dependent oxidoreductase [Cronbergia sp. UHCC 0137]
MQPNYQTNFQNLVLLGGGHSHSIVLKLFSRKPIPKVRLTIITPDRYTPYSGMLPGHIAGFYSYDECHIDLQSLSKFADVKLYFDQAVGLDLKDNKVLCANRTAIDFDLLSIDIGSTPAKLSVSGAAEYAIPAKPVDRLLKHWYELQKNVEINPQIPISIAIVGGGAGGVELALSMQSNLQQILQRHQQPITNLEVDLFQKTGELMPNYHPSVRRLMQQVLMEKGVKLHLGETVSQVAPIVKNKFQIKCESGLNVAYNRIFWVTQASAPNWVKASGIGTDEEGFILVDDNLQSVTHPHIFAAGDIATMINHRLPKAGVFAVRQGKPLFKNLQRMILGKSLQPYKPQKEYLSLIGTGDGKAICNRGALILPPHQLIWKWKDCIDRHFMEQFPKLPKT